MHFKNGLFNKMENAMRTQTYFHTRMERDADIRNEAVPLQVNCCGVVADQVFNSQRVRRDFYLMYALKGEIVTKNFTLFPGDMVIFEPGYVYSYQSTQPATYLWVHFTGAEACELIGVSRLKCNAGIHIGLHEEVNDCFRKLFREFILHDEAADRISNCLLQEILALSGRFAEGKGHTPLKALEYIHSHIHEEIVVEELAQLERMSATAFRMAFKQHTGTAPNDYIIAQKLSAACRLLAQTDSSVSEVAMEVGYHDPYYFSRVFKKKMGIAPLRYRKNTRG